MITLRHPPVGMPRGVADDIRLSLNNSTAGEAFRQLPHQFLANEIAGERDRSIGSSKRASVIWPSSGGQLSGYPLDPLRARRPRLERIAEILGLAGPLPLTELHDAHGIGRPPVIGQDIFGDPEVARAGYPPHGEAFPVRLRGARRLNLLPPADALARLRIFEHRVLSINVVLRLEVVRIGSGPVTIQSRSNPAVIHTEFPAVDDEPSPCYPGNYVRICGVGGPDRRR